jgi:hypothetical protein
VEGEGNRRELDLFLRKRCQQGLSGIAIGFSFSRWLWRFWSAALSRGNERARLDLIGLVTVWFSEGEPGVAREEVSGGDALGDGGSVGAACDFAVARARVGVFAVGCGVFGGMAFHVPCGPGARAHLDCLVFAPQRRPRLHFGVPLPPPCELLLLPSQFYM